MLCLAVTNLAKEFDLHSRFGETPVSMEFLDLNVRTTPLLKFYLNCSHRQIGGQNGGFNLTLQLLH